MAISPGNILRNKREEKKLSLEQAALETNIRIQFLQAIEEDRMGAISSQAQLRGFIRLYASYLGLNPLEIFEPVNPLGDSLAPVEEGVNPGEQIKDALQVEPQKSLLDVASNLLRKKTEKTQQQKQASSVDQNIPEKVSTSLFKSIGADLEQQREELGLSRYDIERQIKIRELYIYALENGLVDDLPSTVQGRGMLNNYAAFMNLDPEPLQTRFAEGLQQRRIEKAEEDLAKKKNPEIKKFNAPITGWRRYLTPDLLIGGGVFAVLFILIIWGALQVIGSSQSNAKPTAEPISEILIGTDTPAALTEQATPDSQFTATPSGGETVNTPSVDLMATISALDNQPIQVVVIAYQRAFLKIISDGKEVFVGRTVPGNVYTYTGSSRITLTTGNAAALQVYYNQQDLGVLGTSGQVLNMDFTGAGMATATPQVTAQPTSTMLPTYTQQPTDTPTVTPTPATPTVTPYRP
jgi:cytoskeletal protein RodZ